MLNIIGEILKNSYASSLLLPTLDAVGKVGKNLAEKGYVNESLIKNLFNIANSIAENRRRGNIICNEDVYLATLKIINEILTLKPNNKAYYIIKGLIGKRTDNILLNSIKKLIETHNYDFIKFVSLLIKSLLEFSFKNYGFDNNIIKAFPCIFEEIFKEMIENKVLEGIIIENFEILKDCGFKLIEYGSENTISSFIRECIYIAIISLKSGYNKFLEDVAIYLKELNKISKEKLNKNLVDEILTEIEKTKSFGIKMMISEESIKSEKILIKDELLENFQKFKEIYYKK